MQKGEMRRHRRHHHHWLPPSTSSDVEIEVTWKSDYGFLTLLHDNFIRARLQHLIVALRKWNKRQLCRCREKRLVIKISCITCWCNLDTNPDSTSKDLWMSALESRTTIISHRNWVVNKLLTYFHRMSSRDTFIHTMCTAYTAFFF